MDAAREHLEITTAAQTQTQTGVINA